MRRFMMLLTCVAVATLGVALAGTARPDDEEKISLDQVPAPVLVVILAELGEGKLLAVLRDTENGKTVYEAEMLIDGRRVEIELAADGTVIGRESAPRGAAAGDDDDDDDGDDGDADDDDGDEDDDGDDGDEDDDGDDDDGKQASLPIGDLPDAARRTLMAHTGDHVFHLSAEQVHGVTVYEAAWEAGGRRFEAEVMADGHLLELEEIVPADEVPAALREAIAKRFPDATQVSYERIQVVVYDVAVTVDGKTREVTVRPTGRFMKH